MGEVRLAEQTEPVRRVEGNQGGDACETGRGVVRSRVGPGLNAIAESRLPLNVLAKTDNVSLGRGNLAHGVASFAHPGDLL